MSVELKSMKTKPETGSHNFGHVNSGFTTDDYPQGIVKSEDVAVDLADTNGTVELQNEEFEENCCSRTAASVQGAMNNFYKDNKYVIITSIKVVITLLYFAYFAYAMYYSFGDEGSIRLLVCTILGVLLIVFKITMHVLEDDIDRMWRNSLKPVVKSSGFRKVFSILSILLKVAVFLVIAAVIIADVLVDYPQNLISVAGLAIYVLLFFIFSKHPGRVNWHPVFWGFALQYIFALLILRTYAGYQTFKWVGDRVAEFLLHADEGAIFLFGTGFEEHYFAFKVLPIVIFFYAFISVLYYLGIMQFIVRSAGRFLSFCMGTSPTESLNAAGNIFVGMTEAPLMIQPFLKDMTKSELHAVMTGGFATIAGSVLGAFVSFGVPANHLISASVMSAPAALAISKLSYPETEVSKSSTKDFFKMERPKDRNIIEAISSGASGSVKVVAAIAVNVLAFLCILKFINETLTWCGNRVGVDDLTFQLLCSYVFFPIAYFMGTDVGDCRMVAELIGIKTFTNEFVAYLQLSTIINNGKIFANYTQTQNMTDWYYSGDDIVFPQANETLVDGILSDKSQVIATYALCGFSNFGSMGILLGGLSALAPSRKSDLSKIVFRAMVCGNVACFLTACIAGLLYKNYD